VKYSPGREVYRIVPLVASPWWFANDKSSLDADDVGTVIIIRLNGKSAPCCGWDMAVKEDNELSAGWSVIYIVPMRFTQSWK
jgi:hypothetical protein